MEYNPPNTRERIAARRQRRPVRPPPPDGSQAQPGPRQTLRSWLLSGRLISAIVLAVSLALLGYVLFSSRLNIRTVQITGNNALSAAEVVALADVIGRPIWFVQPDAVTERLMTAAYVESAAVDVVLPDVTTIEIVERRPEVRWLAGGVQYLVDGTGKVLGVAQEPAEPNVLVIVDNSHLQLQPSDRLDPDALDLARALALRLPGELGFTPAQIGWDMALGVYVRSSANQTIVFGRSDELDRKLAVLSFLLTDGTAFTYLDLRPSTPFYQNTAAPDTAGTGQGATSP
jgi:cell division protein FtsQ